jgi:hypothetical protein
MEKLTPAQLNAQRLKQLELILTPTAFKVIREKSETIIAGGGKPNLKNIVFNYASLLASALEDLDTNQNP